jgi:DnaK suppressor protein
MIKKVKLAKNYKPKKRERYMNDKQLEYFRLKLLDWRKSLLEESQETIDNMREAARDVSDEAERASRETEITFELRTRDRYRKLLRKIDQALERIEDGSYGYCDETGDPIGLERLEARPIATLSIEAQERRERMEQQYGEN